MAKDDAVQKKKKHLNENVSSESAENLVLVLF